MQKTFDYWNRLTQGTTFMNELNIWSLCEENKKQKRSTLFGLGCNINDWVFIRNSLNLRFEISDYQYIMLEYTLKQHFGNPKMVHSFVSLALSFIFLLEKDRKRMLVDNLVEAI